MKKLIILVLAAILLSSCGHSLKGPDNKIYECYGFFDKDDIKKDNIRYELVGGNIVLCIVFFESLVVPILLLGFQTHCPVEVLK